MAGADDRPTMDEVEGRLEHAVAARTGDTDSERDGRIDRTTGSVKQNIDRVADKVKGLLRSDG